MIGKIILLLFVLFVVILAVVAIGVKYAHRIKPQTILTLRMEGDIPEYSSRNAFEEALNGRTTSLTDITEGLDRARADSRITALELRVSETGMNMAQIQEVRDAIQQFNQAGKFSVAYLEFASNRSYYLASACQTVEMLPKSEFHLHGMMAYATFLRGTFDKLGIVPDFIHIGEYKNATSTLTEKKFTPAHREATQALLDDWYGQFVQGVASSRKMKADAVEKAIAAGPYTTDDAPATGLIDKVGYVEDFRQSVEQKNHGSARRMSLRSYLDRTDEFTLNKIAVIYAVGDIGPGRSANSPVGGQLLGSDTMARQFRRAREDSSVKAVVVRVDSPGGVAFSSEVMRHELELTQAQKPVVVSMSDVAASGGYWLSMSANRIIAEPGTITGSIGVLSGKFNLSGLYDKLGLSTDYIATTPNSTLEYPLQSFTPEQRELEMKNMTETYQDFLRGVAQGRHMKVEEVDKIAQGRVWTGERAQKLGLVDELGGLHTAITRARELAKIPANEKLGLMMLPERKSFFERLLSRHGDDADASPELSLGGWISRLETLSDYSIWTILPGVPEAQ
jgi:protease-4